MKVILTGYRACGKTTVGILLSNILNIPFVDTDLLLEKNLGMTVKEIIEQKGWDFFRERERETVRSLKQSGAGVIATGGGVITYSENVTLLKQMGVIIWLNAPLSDIINRLKEDAQAEAKRPQFTQEDLARETTDIWNQRYHLYKSAANFVVDTEGKNAPAVADEIHHYLLKAGIMTKFSKSGN